MVGTDKVKGFALTILLVVDSPNTLAVGQRISCGFRVSTSTSSTAHPLHSTERARPNHHPRAPLTLVPV